MNWHLVLIIQMAQMKESMGTYDGLTLTKAAMNMRNAANQILLPY
jgi:hypothetical protein